MYKFLTKNGQLIAFGLGTLLTIIFYVLVSSGLEEFTALDIAKDPKRFETTIFDFGLTVARGLTFLGAIIAVLFGIYHTATNPKGAIKVVAGLVLVAVVFGIAYSMADGGVKEKWATDFAITPDISKMVEASILTTLGLLGIALAIFVLGEIRNLFK